MKARFMKKSLWHVVNTGPSADEKQEQCDTFDLLVGTISGLLLSRVYGTSAKNVWEKL